MTEDERQLAYIERELQKDREPGDLRILTDRKQEILRQRERAQSRNTR